MMLLKVVGASLLMVATWFMIFVLFLLADPANAQTDLQCAPQADVTAGLLRNFGEAPINGGIVGDGEAYMRTFVNDDTGSWTIVYVTADGMACLMGSGSAYSGAPNA